MKYKIEYTLLLICLLICSSVEISNAAVTITQIKGQSATAYTFYDVAWHPTKPLAIIVGAEGSSDYRVYFYHDSISGNGTLEAVSDSVVNSHEYFGVAWHPDGEFAILVGDDQDAVVRYDLRTDTFSEINVSDNNIINFTSIAVRPVKESGEYYFYMVANVESGYNEILKLYKTNGISGVSSVAPYQASNNPWYCYKTSWLSDGDHILLANTGWGTGSPGILDYAPGEDTISYDGYQTGNGFSVAYHPTSSFALSGIGSDIYKVTRNAPGDLNLTIQTGMLVEPFAMCWHTAGQAALAGGYGSSVLRYSSTGAYSGIASLPATGQLMDGDWRPGWRHGLLVGEDSWVLKFVDGGISNPDTDSDGMLDQWEIEHFSSLSKDGTGDEDDDGLLDLNEFEEGTDPNDEDTDDDGMRDEWEVDNDFNPKVPDCDIYLEDIEISSGETEDFTTECSITAGPDFIIENGGNSTFTAGTEIILLPGFEARLDCTFSAVIQ